MADNKKSSTTPKKLTNKEIREARKRAKLKEEKIPAGMKAEDYADAAFRKKVTIIMGSILLVFIIGVIAVLVGAKLQTDKHNAEFDRIESEFITESQAVKTKIAEIEANGGKFEDKAVVQIELNDDNYTYWIAALDASYQLDKSDPDYACYGGATIHLQGHFVKRVFAGNTVNYWVYRPHDDLAHGHSHSLNESATDTSAAGGNANDTKIPIETISAPIEVIFADKNAEIPEDGAWVDVTGVVGVDSNGSLSAVHNAVVTVSEEPHSHE